MPSDDRAPRGPIPLGPVGRYVISNLEFLRNARRLTYRELSERLSQLGRPIPTLGLSRIEKGDRRVDVDDLVALAVALGVNPSALLLPSGERGNPRVPDDVIALTPELQVKLTDAWEWADGQAPVPNTGQPPNDFENTARPTWLHREIFRAEELPEKRRRLEEELNRVRILEEVAELGRADREGRPANKPIPVEEALAQPVVAAIVTSQLGVLVGQRNDGKPPWTFIAGEVEPGESPADAAVREVKEETGLRVRAGDVIGERVHPKTGRTMIYMAAAPTHGTKVIVGDEDELADVRWITLAEADELLPGMFEPVHEYLERELGEAAG
jgi:8-oxo-dGTP pyrophosphatase MutT (NUDIX family)/transcriptional regulator with XRE-family HTH domain